MRITRDRINNYECKKGKSAPSLMISLAFYTEVDVIVQMVFVNTLARLSAASEGCKTLVPWHLSDYKRLFTNIERF